MNRRQNQSALAAALQLSICLMLMAVSAALFAPSFHGASSKLTVVDANPGAGINPPPTSQLRELSLTDRVAYQYAIEEVYWRHRIWPKENGRPKPPLDEVISTAQLREKVERTLRDSRRLASIGHPITSEQLQAEMERMARDTKQPDVLHELFVALNNDSTLVAECLARPILSQRLAEDLAAHSGELEIEPKRGVDPERPGHSNDDSNAAYTLPEIVASATSCTDDAWTVVSNANAPSDRSDHATIWTGSEMIVWGGSTSSGGTNTGGRYNPSTDSWVATTTTNAPVARYRHTAVWTGTEVIVWGGSNNGTYVNGGGRYNPITDTWVATTTTGAPTGRYYHAAVWSGNKMIVWGGQVNTGVVNTGGRYDPNTDSWLPTTTAGAPTAREYFTSIWSGSEMIVWGGYPTSAFNTGARYDPNTDSWTATTNTGAPAGRYLHTALWTGSEMIVWGGYINSSGPTNTGGRYNPITNSWVATTTTNGPVGRYSQTAVWSGDEMIVWGGYGDFGPMNSGGRYNLSLDYWANLTTNNAPAARYLHSGVWTGSEMIIWGGTASGGGRYCVQVPPPPTPTPCAPCPPTPSPTPTPIASPTPFEGIGGYLFEGFDYSNPPALPAGWHSSFTNGAADCSSTDTCQLGTNWVTTTNNPYSGSVCVFHDAPGCVTDSVLDSPSFYVRPDNYIFLSWGFRHNFNLENGRDGGVVEISLNGGPFTDIVAAGGTANYNGTISTAFQSPIAGRQAWTGDSGGYINGGGDLPSAAIGQNVVLRFRLATDCSGSGTGWFLDQIAVSYRTVYPPVTPTATPLTRTISGVVGNCASPAPTATPPANPTPPILPPVQNVLMTLTGTSSGTTMTNPSGSYSFTVNTGGSYTVTPSKGSLAPASANINITDILAIQRHFLNITLIPAGCRLTAADAVVDGTINSQDVIAVQRFFLGFTSGIGSCGQYKFIPASRSYSSIGSNLLGQDYAMYVIGDVASPFANRPEATIPPLNAPEMPALVETEISGYSVLHDSSRKLQNKDVPQVQLTR